MPRSSLYRIRPGSIHPISVQRADGVAVDIHFLDSIAFVRGMYANQMFVLIFSATGEYGYHQRTNARAAIHIDLWRIIGNVRNSTVLQTGIESIPGFLSRLLGCLLLLRGTVHT